MVEPNGDLVGYWALDPLNPRDSYPCWAWVSCLPGSGSASMTTAGVRSINDSGRRSSSIT